jgi:DNA-binding FadR family transcriptional regulator
MKRSPVRRAAWFALTLQNEIEDNDLQPGHNLGHEAELCEKYQVSRAVFREAVRLLEYHDIARMKTGRAGGLIVGQPGVEPLTAALVLQLRRRDVTPTDLIDARKTIEVAAVTLATARLTDQGVEQLRRHLLTEKEASLDEIRNHAAGFHLLIGQLSGNPVYDMFTQTMISLTYKKVDPPTDSEANDAIIRAHYRIADAMIAGDAALAQYRMNRHFAGIAESWGTNLETIPAITAPLFAGNNLIES